MSHQSEPEPSNFTKIFERALEEYESRTGKKWKKHSLARQLEQCYSLESVEGVLQEQAQAFTQSGGSDSTIVKWLKSAVPILFKLSTNTTLRKAITVPFPFANPILIAISSLLGAAKDVIASHDELVNLLELIGESVDRLHIYTTVTLQGAMVDFVVKIMVQVLNVLGLVTREMKRSSSTKITKRILGEKDIEESLQKLNELRLREVPWTAALALKHTDILVKGQEETNKMLQQITSDNNKSKRDESVKGVRTWLSPPDPLKNQDEHSKLRHPGTAAQFVAGKTFSNWKRSEQSSLLWIRGNPGAGKSVLCSAIIQDIEDSRKSQPAILMFYYCDYKEERKRDLRGLLTSLLVQLCDQSDSYCDLLSEFFKDHKDVSQRATDASLALCLKNILGQPRQHPVYLVVDALDECPNPPVRLPPRKEVLQLLKDLVTSIPNLHTCVTSRPEADIMLVLDPLTSYTIPLHDEQHQIDDINGYITWFVNNDEGMQGWTKEVKEHVIDVLTRKANGMFRWVDCQLPYLRDCPSSDIQEVLDGLPETLYGTYERALREIKGTHQKSAHRLFQCIAVASRPLTVKELAEVFAFDFKAHPVPKFRKDWRHTDPVHAILSACSSLLTIVNVEDTQVMQFSHFSVKEFMISDHLSNANVTISHYHISTKPAHTLVARVCLGILLHLPKDVTSDDLENFPLARYAAEYWVDHARFEDVSQEVEDGMKELFNPRKSHLAVWTWIYDRTASYLSRMKRDKTPSKPSKTALHYAAFYGLLGIVQYLITEHSQEDVEAHGFGNMCTAVYVALAQGHVEVARALLGAVTTGKVGDGEHTKLPQVLLDGAVETAQNEDGSTPLYFALDKGYFELAQVLLKHGADATGQNANGLTPLHFALDKGYFEFALVLIDYGADVNAQNESGWTPLHFASDRGDAEFARLLVQRGATHNVNARNQNGWTPLHFASDRGNFELVRVLLMYGADPTARNDNGWTPLHFASDRGYAEFARFFLDYGVDVDARNENGSTPLHFASDRGYTELARLLIECGAEPTARDNDGWTPLHFASDGGHLELAQALLEYDAVATAQDGKGQTPISLASSKGHAELVQVLREHNAVLTAQNAD